MKKAKIRSIEWTKSKSGIVIHTKHGSTFFAVGHEKYYVRESARERLYARVPYIKGKRGEIDSEELKGKYIYFHEVAELPGSVKVIV